MATATNVNGGNVLDDILSRANNIALQWYAVKSNQSVITPGVAVNPPAYTPPSIVAAQSGTLILVGGAALIIVLVLALRK